MDRSSSERKALYTDYRTALRQDTLPTQVRASAWVAALGIVGFVPVDYVFYPDLWKPFALLRLATVGITLALGYGFGTSRAELRLIGVAATTALALLIVTAATGGATSPYYSGLMLLIIALPVIAPFTASQALLTNGLLTLGFGLLPLLHTEPIEMQVFGLHLVFLGLATGVSMACAKTLDDARFADFLRMREVELARDALAELDDAKTRFAANVHHELRTPLTLMLAPLEGIRAGDYGPVEPAVERTVRTMHVNGQRLLKLINNLLDLAKLESQQFEIRRAPLELAGLIENVVEGAKPMAERKGLQLRTEGLGEVPSINADGDALEKILVNLLGNALKFTDAGGEIAIGVRPADGGVDVYVRDTGVGLAPDQLARVFDRFAQVDSSATRQHEGTGIGLSLTQELVGLHGGRIWAESEGLGCGATMFFFLPIGESDAIEEELVLTTGDGAEFAMGRSIAAVEAELGLEQLERGREESARYVELDRSVQRWEERQGDGEGAGEVDRAADLRPQILVADDNPDMRELIAFILGREFGVRTARDGREAFELLQTFEPDLIVSDIMMPEMSGTELCKAVKNDARLRDVPVMLVSSKAESEMKIEGLELGADDYVTKPFHPRELLARARSHASLRRARRDLADRNLELERTLRELKLAEAQLVQSERLAAVGELAAGIAHEVNNPVNYSLNALRAMTDVVEELREIANDAAALDWDDRVKLETQGKALRDKIEAAGAGELASTLGELSAIASDGLDRTHRLVVDLRDFAAPGQAGRTQLVDVRDGVRSTAQLVKHDLAEVGVTIALEFPPTLGLVEADPGALNQVFLNLIRNASDAMEGTGGSIAVEVCQGEAEVQVHVRDSGSGIPADVLGRLFEPFFTTKEAGRGTGLGLSMCRKIADAHGGRLEVETQVDVGSRFTLSLPLAERQAEAPGEDRAPDTGGGTDAS